MSFSRKRRSPGAAADVEGGQSGESGESGESMPLQERLWPCLERGDIERFVQLLPECADVDGPRRGEFQETLLMVACQKGYFEAASALLENGADPNICDVRGLNALRLAARNQQFQCLELLLTHPRTDTAAMGKEQWRKLFIETGILSPVFEEKESSLNCIRLLMEHPNFEANKPGLSGETYIALALKTLWEHRVRLFLEACPSKIDVDWQKPLFGFPLRSVIQQKFPRLSRLLPPRRMEDPNSSDKHIRLLALVQRKDVLAVERMIEVEENLDVCHFYEEPYHCTLLHLACRVKGYDEFIPILVKQGADPNARHPISGDTPIHMAAEALNTRAIWRLLSTGKVDITKTNTFEENSLHLVIRFMMHNHNQMQDLLRVLELLLDYTKDGEEEPKIDVNATNWLGETALHYAARCGFEQALLLLIRRGGDLHKTSDCGETVLELMDRESLRAFLNEQVSVYQSYQFDKEKSHYPKQRDRYKLHFNYDSFIPNLKEKPEAREMDTINYIKNNVDLRPLITHPLIRTFLYLRWNNIKVFFKWNLVLYLLFVVCITGYSFMINVYPEGNTNTTCIQTNPINCTAVPHDMANETNVFEGENGTLENFSDCNVPITSEMPDDFNNSKNSLEECEEDALIRFTTNTWRFFSLVLLIFLFIREGVQLAISKHRYFLSLENILELLLFTGTILTLFTPFFIENGQKHICSVLILLAWTELILLSGRLPTLSVRLEMFKKVAFTFSGFMAWYSLIIFAFAFSFFVLFYEEKPFFLNPALTLLKTFTMLTGEFDAERLNFENAPITSHIIFLFFVLFVAIVLLNLLTGLAVYDTKKIKEDAKILSLISMASLVVDSEDFLQKIIFVCKKLKMELVEAYLSRELRLFNHDIPHRQIYVSRVDGSVTFVQDDQTTKRFKKYKMSESMMEEVMKRNKGSVGDKIKKAFAEFSLKIGSIGKTEASSRNEGLELEELKTTVADLSSKIETMGETLLGNSGDQ